MSRSVLITGASGYIGRLLVRALAEDRRGLETIVATDVCEVPVEARMAGVVYERLDVRTRDAAELFRAHRAGVVVHLAAIVNPGPESSRELEYSVDVEGTHNVLEACLAAKVGRLIVTSSGAAYGYHPDNAPLLTEDSPLRGHPLFAYAHHKRLVEEELARYRAEHPELLQLVFRPGTVLGRGTSNQITNLFEKPVVLGLKESATPFVFIWDEDVVACLVEGVHSEKTGTYNLAGDGVMTLREIASALGKPYVRLPRNVLERMLHVLRGVTRYGPEQVDFLAYRPVLSNEKLKQEFGYRPRLTSRQVFELYRSAHG